MLARLLRQIRGSRARRTESAVARLLGEAVTHYGAGDFQAAGNACRAILKPAPDHAEARHLLAMTLLEQHDPAAAIAILAALVETGHADEQVHWHLGSAWEAHQRPDRALAQYQRAVDVNPAFGPGYLSMAELHRTGGRYTDAERLYRQAMASAPGLAEAPYGLGNLLRDLGRSREAAVAYRQALALRPGFVEAEGNLLYVLQCDPACTAEEVCASHLRWGEQCEAIVATRLPLDHVNAPDPGRRLRIGYVSPDFYRHSVSYFMEPLLERHDRRAFEVWCYFTGSITDEVTARLRGLADHWVEAAALSDDVLSQQIRADGIDLLVDLDGHFRHSRLAVFARKPAPVQVTYLGYPTTTGLRAIDYRITDAVVDPPGSEGLNSEQPVRLPGSYFCFRPYPEAPDVGPLPALRKGQVTFGSCNAMMKIGAETIALWAQVLRHSPGSRLVLKGKGLEVAGVRDAMASAFEGAGIARDRLDLHGWESSVGQHLAFYQRIDIALDPYPYNGATTSCEALWMGVPVVTLRGSTHAGRMGASLLQAAGLGELVTADHDEYTGVATSLASDLTRLSVLRTGLRGRLRASVLMDERGFTENVEKEYRWMWNHWCARHPDQSEQDGIRP